MNNRFKRFHIISGIVVMILGTLLHFTYNWSRANPFIAIFSSINESTWEHLKLLFFPMLLTTIIGSLFFFKSSNSFLCARVLGIFISISFTIIFFYTYSGIFGKNIPIVDISSFFFSVIIGEYISYNFIKNNTACNRLLAITAIFFLSVLFLIFTFIPPHIGLFKDPITETYGIQKEL